MKQNMCSNKHKFRNNRFYLSHVLLTRICLLKFQIIKRDTDFKAFGLKYRCFFTFIKVLFNKLTFCVNNDKKQKI